MVPTHGHKSIYAPAPQKTDPNVPKAANYNTT